MRVAKYVDEELIAAVEARLSEVFEAAHKRWKTSFGEINVSFDLKGHCAGIAYSDKRIRFNLDILRQYPIEFCGETVPHEAAHVITDTLFGADTKPHGKEWKFVMEQLQFEPKRCHSFNTSPARIHRERRWRYDCSCGLVEETTRTHHRIQRGEVNYCCSDCGAVFQFVGEVSQVSTPIQSLVAPSEGDAETHKFRGIIVLLVLSAFILLLAILAKGCSREFMSIISPYSDSASAVHTFLQAKIDSLTACIDLSHDKPQTNCQPSAGNNQEIQ